MNRVIHRWVALAGVALLFGMAGAAFADVPTRVGVRGTVPNPGTQQQELANLTFPAPYNVFEFIVTCAACHGGTIDQQVAHFGNWSGTAMASAARDPVFRANQIIVNNAIQAAIGKDGAGNMCFRCHSPNGWYSGRFDPTLNGAGDGSQMLHSILLSTDDEGIPCEMCHRTMGGVEFRRSDLDTGDPVWNMMAGIDDWPHSGMPYIDQDGSPTIAAGNPYGDTTLQIDDGMTYIGRYPGSVDIYWKDAPLVADPTGPGGYSVGGNYTGQTYGVYPPGWRDPLGNDVGGQPATTPEGNLVIQQDVPIGPPLNPDGSPNYNAQSVSLEHPTAKYPNLPPAPAFIQTSEFCGTCHDLTVPVLNHGMPEQRTFTEWKYSDFGREGPDKRTCQECHMPRLSHEYTDTVTGSLNADPVVSGYFPYAKSRTNTAMHKLAGANRDLPQMMKALYPEVDFEVIGGAPGAGGVWVGTGNDPRIFPGMLSNRDPMWERNLRNTEISLLDGVDIAVSQAPTQVGVTADGQNGVWELKVKVTNNTGHRIPSGYPDGRRFWIEVNVTDGATPVYRSGYYDQAAARLLTAPGATGLNRALEPLIDATVANAVMVYERVTGTYDQATNTYTPSLSLLNDLILFDNRIPPRGFDYPSYQQAGIKFWNYDPATFTPYEDTDRYLNGGNYDEVTYRFVGPADPAAALNVRAEAYWQSHTREFMEHLRASDTSSVRPEGPPRPWSANYPLDPNYLSEEFGLIEVEQQMHADGWLTGSEYLRDNWGGIAYAAWYITGKGAPYLAAVADTAATLPPAPTNLRIELVTNPDTNLIEAYTQKILWDPVPGADGYLLWIQYGLGATTASWDRLAVVEAPVTELINTAINVNKTYSYKVQAFSGAGLGPESAVVSRMTPADLPLPPENLRFVSSTTTTITMSWADVSDNEIGWIVFRQDVPPDPAVGFTEIARLPSTNPAGFGGETFTDGDQTRPNVTWAAGYTAPQPGHCYNYTVEAYNNSGNSGPNINGPVQMCTLGPPAAPRNLVATAVSGTRVELTWSPATGVVDGYRVQRSTDGGVTWPATFPIADPAATSYSDTATAAGTTYTYQVLAYNAAGDSPPSNMATVTTPVSPPAAPADLTATIQWSWGVWSVMLRWRDRANNEEGFYIERQDDPAVGWVRIDTMGPVSGSGRLVTYNDTTAPEKTTIQYRVAAYRGGGTSVSNWSNVASIVTPGEVPQAPSNLRVAFRGATSITLRWADNSTNESSFILERSRDNFATVEATRQVSANVTIYSDTGLLRRTQYWYRIMARNAFGDSEYSNVVTTKTK